MLLNVYATFLETIFHEVEVYNRIIRAATDIKRVTLPAKYRRKWEPFLCFYALR